MTGNMDDVPDKSFMNHHFTHPDYIVGINSFINFVSHRKKGVRFHLCPCAICKNNPLPKDIVEIYHHLLYKGFHPPYTVWNLHGEDSGQPAQMSRQRQWLLLRAETSSDAGPSVPPHVEIIQDVFPYHPGYQGDALHNVVEENA